MAKQIQLSKIDERSHTVQKYTEVIALKVLSFFNLTSSESLYEMTSSDGNGHYTLAQPNYTSGNLGVQKFPCDGDTLTDIRD